MTDQDKVSVQLVKLDCEDILQSKVLQCPTLQSADLDFITPRLVRYSDTGWVNICCCRYDLQV